VNRSAIISVVTVVLDDVLALEKTIQSVLSQNLQTLEFIVVDGGSTDGTLEVIKRFQSRIDYWISEPDRGPYDAMNKGLFKATGDWVIFLNSGDRFADPMVLSRIFSQDMNNADIIYGDSIADYGRFRFIRKAGPPTGLWKDMVFSHQSVIIRTSIIQEDGFQLQYKIGADYEMVMRLFLSGKRFYYFPEPISITEAFGISHRHMFSSGREHYRILRSMKTLTFKEKKYHLDKLFFLSVISAFYRFIPKSLYLPIIKKINHKNLVTL